MPDWLNEPGEWTAVITIFTSVMAALLWIIRKEILTQRREFKPNGGASMRDAINRIEANQHEIRTEVMEIRRTVGEQNDRIFNSVGKVHSRIDEHIANDHLRDKRR